MNSADHPDAHRVWFRLICLHGKMSAAISRRLREIHLSVPQCDVLTTLMACEGISQQSLADRLHVTKGNISGLVDRLARAGLVERRILDGDRRTHAIHLTGKGRRLAERGVEIQRDFVAQSLGNLSPQQLQKMDALLALTSEFLRSIAPGTEAAETE
jgi:DNA-binding MarR family transcriptional regulator